jgi:hypothetical protein
MVVPDDAVERGRRVLDRAFPSEAASAAFHGVVGHYHLTRDKFDPGPAFDWERFLAAARRRLAGRE